MNVKDQPAKKLDVLRVQLNVWDGEVDPSDPNCPPPKEILSCERRSDGTVELIDRTGARFVGTLRPDGQIEVRDELGRTEILIP